MKAHLFFIVLFFSIFSAAVFAQPAQGNVIVVTKMELKFGPEFNSRMLDSLSSLYEKEVVANNPYIIDHKTMRHWWGHDNTEFVVMYTVKNLEDMEKAYQEMDKIFMEKWKTKEEQDAYDNAYNKFFTGKHSDEIYREIK